jgi:hypothetical protein
VVSAANCSSGSDRYESPISPHWAAPPRTARSSVIVDAWLARAPKKLARGFLGG